MKINGQQIVCITFDLDDTLWSCAPVIVRAESIFFEWLGEHFPSIASDFNIETLTLHRRQVFAEYPEKAHDFSWLRKRWLGHLSREYGCDDALVDKGFAVFLAARNNVTVYDGVTGLLAALNRRYRCGSITNGNADINLVGLGKYFDFEVTASAAGAAKPDPRIFAAAIDAAGVPAASILHVGDDPDRDVRGARRQGMQTAWINTVGEAWQGDDRPSLEFAHVTELARLLNNDELTMRAM